MFLDIRPKSSGFIQTAALDSSIPAVRDTLQRLAAMTPAASTGAGSAGGGAGTAGSAHSALVSGGSDALGVGGASRGSTRGGSASKSAPRQLCTRVLGDAPDPVYIAVAQGLDAPSKFRLICRYMSF